MPKYLVIRLSSIGDIVLTTPVLRMLKKQILNAEIHYLTKPQYKQILVNNTNIDKIWLYEKNMAKLLRELKKENFDYIIDLHNNLRTFRIKNSLRILSFTVKKLNIAKWLMVNFKVNYLPKQHIVERYLDTLRLFDISDDKKGLDYFIGVEDECLPKFVSDVIPNEYIAICIGGRHFTKKMPAEKVAELCSMISYPLILLGGKEDIATADEICKLTSNKLILNFTGRLSLNMSAILVRDSKMVITHDTGLMHIAAAFKKNIVSIWGNTIPEFGMVPYRAGKGSLISEVKGLSCRPCSKIGFDKCPKSHFRCMIDQDINKVADWVNKAVQISN